MGKGDLDDMRNTSDIEYVNRSMILKGGSRWDLEFVGGAYISEVLRIQKRNVPKVVVLGEDGEACVHKL